MDSVTRNLSPLKPSEGRAVLGLEIICEVIFYFAVSVFLHFTQGRDESTQGFYSLHWERIKTGKD